MMPLVLLLAMACVALLIWTVYMRRLPMPILLAGPVVNALTFWFYWRDKYAAQQGLRHKSAKASFQEIYWFTVVVNIAVLLAMTWPTTWHMPSLW